MTAAKLVRVPLKMGKTAHRGAFSSPIKQDPFTVSLKEKLDFLGAIDARLKRRLDHQTLRLRRIPEKEYLFFNSEGTEVERKLRNVFGK